MTTETRAAISRARCFIAVEEAQGATDDTPIIDGVDTLTIGHLRALLTAADAPGQPDFMPDSTEALATAEAAEHKANYLGACKTIADMHAAAVGEVRGPIRGVVEDVADVRERMLMAEALRPAADDMLVLGLPSAQHMPAERLVPFLRFCKAVWEECDRQWAKWGDQQHSDGTGGQRWRDARNHVQNETDSAAQLGRVTWLDIAREEIFEAFAEDGLRALSGELVQSAAVLATWLFDLGRRSSWPLPAIAADAPSSPARATDVGVFEQLTGAPDALKGQQQ